MCDTEELLPQEVQGLPVHPGGAMGLRTPVQDRDEIVHTNHFRNDVLTAWNNNTGLNNKIYNININYYHGHYLIHDQQDVWSIPVTSDWLIYNLKVYLINLFCDGHALRN